MDTTLQSIVQVLAAHKPFSTLSRGSLEAIASVARPMRLPSGALIVREGDEGADLFLLVSGSAAAVRAADDGGQVVLNAIAPGDCIGELTFLDGGRRSASVRAETPCELVRIPADELRGAPDAQALVGDLKGALASVVVNRARSLSDEMLVSLRHQLEIKTIQNQFGNFLVLTIALFLISSTLFYLVAERYIADVYDPRFAWQAILFFALPCLLMIRIMKIPLRDLGIRRERLWRSLAESAAICVAIAIPVGVYFLWFAPAPIGEAVGDETSGGGGAGATVDLFFLVQYFFHTVFQEVGARGLLQGLFQKFLDDRKGHKAILLTSAVFAPMHLAFGVDAVVVTFVASIAFGYVYLRQKNLAGVILLHYWLGVLAAVSVAF